MRFRRRPRAVAVHDLTCPTCGLQTIRAASITVTATMRRSMAAGQCPECFGFIEANVTGPVADWLTNNGARFEVGEELSTLTHADVEAVNLDALVERLLEAAP